MKKVSGKKKEITINDLAVMIDGLAVGIAKVDKKTDNLAMLVDNLAIMTANRFDRVEDRLESVEHDISAVRLSVLNLSDQTVKRYEFDDLRVRFNHLEQKVEGKARK